MVNTPLTYNKIHEEQSSFFIERPEWAWLKHDEEFEFE